MITVYVNVNRGFEEKPIDEFGQIGKDKVVWIDVVDPTDEEIEWLQSTIGFIMPSKEVLGDIEISSKYMETEDSISANMSFVIQRKEEIIVEPVFFFYKEQNYSESEIYGYSAVKILSEQGKCTKDVLSVRGIRVRRNTEP